MAGVGAPLATPSYASAPQVAFQFLLNMLKVNSLALDT